MSTYIDKCCALQFSHLDLQYAQSPHLHEFTANYSSLKQGQGHTYYTFRETFSRKDNGGWHKNIREMIPCVTHMSTKACQVWTTYLDFIDVSLSNILSFGIL